MDPKWTSGNELKYLNEVLSNSEEVRKNPFTDRLEDAFCEKYDVKYAIAVNSGTSGLHAALIAAGVEPGDEVITTPWTMSATATAILQWNAIPVFCDIDKKTFCIDPKKIEERITHKTKAIIAVDIFGQSSDMLPIMEIANRHSLKVVSDTAQAPGAKYNEKYAGTLAHIGGFSFNYHKHIHCGEGGVIVTNDDDLAYRSKLIRNHGENVIGSKGINNIIGCNYRLGEIECAIAYEQLKKLDKNNSKRKNIAKRYSEELDIEVKMKFQKDCSYHIFWIQVKNREQFMMKMKQEKIETGIHYLPIHKMSFYKKFSKKLKMTEDASTKIVSLPIHPNLSEKDITRIIKSVNKFM